MIFINCNQADESFRPLVEFVKDNEINVLKALLVNDIPAEAKCIIYSDAHKEFVAITDGSLELTFEYAGAYTVKIIAPGYKEVFDCEVAPFHPV
tara:strand:+ start:5649 stop:5930 length:282 start_codon:yes stop_codon:yes gene_type:complete